MAKRSHPFPYRTRKLSSSAPMVVGVSPCKSRTLLGYDKTYQINNICGGLAQLGEHLPYKQGVGGSIPSSSTILAGVAQLVEQLTCNQYVEGSSPFSGTT